MNGMMFVDSHTHLLDDRFDEDRSALIAQLHEQEIAWIVEAAFDLDSSVRAAALAREHATVYAMAGIHPHEASTYDAQTKDALCALTQQRKVVAVGEIGLDYHYDFSPRDCQRRVFEQQMQMAVELDLPVVIHSREATADVLAMLRNFPKVHCNIHCFSGSPQTAEQMLAMGHVIAFGGALTFQNAKKAVESCRVVPLERMLIETDCPYMTPVPHRGKRNEPQYVRLVAERIALIRGVDVEEVARCTSENAAAFFGIAQTK